MHMITVFPRQGRRIEITLERELRSPVDCGEHVRAYCHVHGSDHQRSLSITKATGWGHCFNATCGATVLVADWNRPLADRLLGKTAGGRAAPPWQPASARAATSAWSRPAYIQPMLIPPPRTIPTWQQEEREALSQLDKLMRQALTTTWRARKSRQERGIPLAIAAAAGTGYLPPSLLKEPGMREHRRLLYRWSERFLFPLASPDGTGYIGRSLWRWQPGLKETAHKALLEQNAGPRRWIKTNPAGWFGMADEQLSPAVMLVEGAFDRLTWLAAGLRANEVIALAGTTLQTDWLPAQVKTVMLAFDGDEGGKEAGRRLADQFAGTGMNVRFCSCAQDRRGKDWNERWQHSGYHGLAPALARFSLARTQPSCHSEPLSTNHRRVH